jgi:carboxyl-terminal processing protease
MTPRPTIRPSRRTGTAHAIVLALLCGVAGARPAATAIDPAVALATFDVVWQQVDESPYDVERAGLDWSAVRDHYRPKLNDVRDIQSLRSLLQQMLDEIGASHFNIIPAPALSVGDAELTGPANFHLGMEVRLVEDQLLVTAVRPDSPADRAGLQTGWQLLSLDDTRLQPALEEIAALQDEGARRLAATILQFGLQDRLENRHQDDHALLELLDRSGARRSLRIDPALQPGRLVEVPMLPPMQLDVEVDTVALPDNRCAGVMAFTVWVPEVANELARRIDSIDDCAGMVIDLRGNPGGVMATMMSVGGFLVTDATAIGTLKTTDATLNFRAFPRTVTTEGERVQPYTGPLAILIDGLSASTSEMFAAGFQVSGRARVFGNPSPGMALPSRTFELPSGDQLLYAFADYTDAGGREIEGIGVQPDIASGPTRSSLLAGEDAALAAALAWIGSVEQQPE